MANTSITWLEGYKPTDAVTEYGTKVSISNRESSGVGGIVDAPFVCGHKTVQTASDLQKIPGSVLSMTVGNTPYANRSNIKKDTNGDIPDALGQEWYVQDEKCKYKVVKFDGTTSTWEKIENSSSIIEDTYTYVENIKNTIGEIKTDVSNNWSYTYNTYNSVRDELSSNWSYTYNSYGYLNIRINDTYDYAVSSYENVNSQIQDAWSYTYSAYAYMLDYMGKVVDQLRSEFIWKSTLLNNTSTYLWSGSLEDFNKIDKKPTDTTFIVTN